MQGKKLDLDTIEKVRELRESGLTLVQIADRLGMSRSKASRASMQVRRLERVPDGPDEADPAVIVTQPPPNPAQTVVTGTFSDVGDGSATLSLSGPLGKLDSLDSLIAQHVDLDVWEVERGELGFYEGYRKDKTSDIEWVDGRIVKGRVKDSGELKTVTMFRGFVRLRYKQTVVQLEGLLERLEAATTPVQPRTPPPMAQDEPQALLALLSAQDVHWGKLSHHDEAGSDYDIKIASRNWYAAVGHLLMKLDRYQIDTGLILVGSDALHTNDMKGHTIAGTAVDVDSRWYKAFDAALECYIWAIDGLLDRCQMVRALVIPGNHGGQMEIALAKVLKAHYRLEERVMIDDRPKPRKALAWGKNLLVFQHHTKGRAADMILNASTEWRREWGEAEHVELHTDHVHHKSQNTIVPGDFVDVKGVICRVSPALCPPDAWHYENGFVGSVKGATVFIYGEESGIEDTLGANITPWLLDAAQGI
jgi:hypothetical protein